MIALHVMILCCCAFQVAIHLAFLGRRRLNVAWLVLGSLAGLVGFVCALWIVVGQVTL